MTTPAGKPAKDPSENAPVERREGPLVNKNGRITVADSVVQKIAGMATREVPGVYGMGSGATRAFGAIRERIPGSNGPNASQGVSVEVGETQAAADLDVVIEYGASIAELGQAIQRNVKQAVERMTGLEVVEVNVSVDDIHLAQEEDTSEDEKRVS